MCGDVAVFWLESNQGGDRYGHGSPITQQTLSSDSIYVKVQPYEWYPDGKGGGRNDPVPTDVEIEQWVSFVSNGSNTIRLRYRVTHLGSDQHTITTQELPSVYANLGFDRFVTYRGSSLGPTIL
jgi:hypothetical protein